MPFTEHALTDAEAKYLVSCREQADKLQTDYYAHLGHAKEIDIQLLALNTSRDQALSLIVKNAGLPQGKLRISPDSRKLIIETE